MPSYSALTTLAGRDAADGLGAALERLDPEPTGIGVFEIEDGSGLWEIGAYFDEAPDEAGLALLAAAFHAKPFAVSEVPDVDWVAKVRRELAPVEAGRFFVYGSHDAGAVPDGTEPLLIEAAMAFGTGHHGTTKGCLLALEALLEAGVPAGPVADVGCGTAVLAMAAARVWDVPIVAGDIDPVAVEVAAANVIANALEGRVETVEAVGFDHPAFDRYAPFSLIFANILKGPLIDLAPAVADRLDPGGHAILSGLLVEQADEVAEVYRQNGINQVSRIDIGDWSCLTVAKNTANLS